MFLSYYYLALVQKGLWQAHNDMYVCSCYVYIFAILLYLTTANQCLTIFLFQKLCVIGKISIR